MSSIFKMLLVFIILSYSSQLFFTTAETNKSIYFNNESKLSISGSYIEVDRFCDMMKGMFGHHYLKTSH